ncbi:MAG: hypothetical protein H7Z20_06265 [Bdellovibrio sp.]|nr:hypothetical protein [Methylotenera sp.]
MDILFHLNSLTSFQFQHSDANVKPSLASETLAKLLNQVEEKTDKTIYNIDTDSDNVSFGLMDKIKLSELIRLGKALNLSISQPR